MGEQARRLITFIYFSTSASVPLCLVASLQVQGFKVSKVILTVNLLLLPLNKLLRNLLARSSQVIAHSLKDFILLL